MTEQAFAQYVYERLKSGNADVSPSIVPRLVTLVPSALRLLPGRVRERLGEPDAELYRKDYTVALTSGQGSLSTHTNLALASEPMIPTEIVKVTHPDAISNWNTTGKLARLGSEAALNLRRSTEFAYYAVDDNILYTMINNSRTALGGSATARAAYPPAIGNVKASHDPVLVELGVELAAGIKS